MGDLFNPQDNNIVFLEDARGELYQNKDFYDALEVYGSVTKAYAFMALKYFSQSQESFNSLRQRRPADIDEAVNLQLQVLSQTSQPQLNPQLAYQWRQYEVIDEFLERGYKLNIVFESSSLAETVDDPRKIVEARSSSEGIAKQLVDLEKEVDPNIQTNVLMDFGSYHIGVISRLPARLQRVTTTNFVP